MIADASTNKVSGFDQVALAYREVGSSYVSSAGVYFLNSMAVIGALLLLASLYCFYRIGRSSALEGSKVKKNFVVGIFLFALGSFLLAYASYSAGQDRIPFIGLPGFDPRVT